jgi:RNA ligase
MTINQERITELVQQGYITARRHPEFPLTIYNYSPKATYESFWTEETLTCRGLILADDGEIVARPFDKFFNWGEGGRTSTADIVNVTEKMDGSLGILYRWQGQFYVATRGSFDSQQAIWASKFLQKHYALALENLSEDLTLLFEIIYPENRVVVDYKGRRELTLLTIRNRFTGEYCPWFTVETAGRIYGFPLPKVYSSFDTPAVILELAKALDPNSEGWVVEFADGQRFKFKGESYLELHRLISGLSFKNTLACMSSGTLKELLEVIPNEFLDQVNDWINQINNRVLSIRGAVITHYQEAPKASRKEYALWVQANCKELAPYMFARLDERDIDELIYKMAFREDNQC